MAHYMMKFKGTYRVLPELDQVTNDFPRNVKGEIADGYDDLYIPCRNGARIYAYGHYPDSKITMWLTAYIPSILKGRMTLKALDEMGVEVRDKIENDEEVSFNFRAKYIKEVAQMLHAMTSGKNISPFSVKNLPKSNYEIPKENIAEYKAIIADLKQNELIVIKRITDKFLEKTLQRTLKKTDKSFNYLADMRKNCMSRQAKEYIHSKGLWEQYINYLGKELKK